MDAEFADAWATEPATTQAAKPKKPFLKRGEGVTKRLNAYKQRPVKSATTGSTDEVGDASRPTASDQADGASSSYWAADVSSQLAGAPRHRSGDQGVQQQQQQLGGFAAQAADTYQLGGKGTTSLRPCSSQAVSMLLHGSSRLSAWHARCSWHTWLACCSFAPRCYRHEEQHHTCRH
jgi:hypothetical protein